MANTPKVYVICDANCKWEGMTKEQILTAIEQAVRTGEISDIDTGFVKTIKTINGGSLRFFVGEQHTYDTLGEEDKKDLFAIITDDTTKEGLFNAFEKIQNDFSEIETKFAVIQIENAETKKSLSFTQTALIEGTFPLGGVRLYKPIWSGSYEVLNGPTGGDFVIFEDTKSFAGRTFEVITEKHGIFRFKFHSGVASANFAITEYDPVLLEMGCLEFSCAPTYYGTYPNIYTGEPYVFRACKADFKSSVVIKEIYEIISNV